MELVKEYYQKGKEAEKTQLPIFANSKLESKRIVEEALSEESGAVTQISNNNNAVTQPRNTSHPLKLTLIREVRQAMQKQAAVMGNMPFANVVSFESKHNQKMTKNLDITRYVNRKEKLTGKPQTNNY